MKVKIIIEDVDLTWEELNELMGTKGVSVIREDEIDSVETKPEQPEKLTPRPNNVCAWCGKEFKNRFSMAAHSMNCPERKLTESEQNPPEGIDSEYIAVKNRAKKEMEAKRAEELSLLPISNVAEHEVLLWLLNKIETAGPTTLLVSDHLAEEMINDLKEIYDMSTEEGRKFIMAGNDKVAEAMRLIHSKLGIQRCMITTTPSTRSQGLGKKCVNLILTSDKIPTMAELGL